MQGLSPLYQLEALSLAYNKIQDQGFGMVLDELLPNMSLRVLDVAGCFITNFSAEHIHNILLSTQKPKRGASMSMSMQMDAAPTGLMRGISQLPAIPNPNPSTKSIMKQTGNNSLCKITGPFEVV